MPRHATSGSYPPGKSGNPGGRPRYTKLSEEQRQRLDEKVPWKVLQVFSPRLAKAAKALGYTEITWLQAANLNQRLLALSASQIAVRAYQEMCDRTQGKPAQEVELSNPDGSAFADPHETLILALARLLQRSQKASPKK